MARAGRESRSRRWDERIAFDIPLSGREGMEIAGDTYLMCGGVRECAVEGSMSFKDGAGAAVRISHARVQLVVVAVEAAAATVLPRITFGRMRGGGWGRVQH